MILVWFVHFNSPFPSPVFWVEWVLAGLVGAGLGIAWIYSISQEARLSSLRDALRSIYAEAMQRQTIGAAEFERFLRLADALLAYYDSMIDSCLESIARTDDNKTWREQLTEWRRLRRITEDQRARLSALVSSRKASPSEEIAHLARLRNEGAISQHEFDAFAERFKVSTGEKARDIIRAISELHGQYKEGAMREGNYHASLWSLMDKLDRKT